MNLSKATKRLLLAVLPVIVLVCTLLFNAVPAYADEPFSGTISYRKTTLYTGSGNVDVSSDGNWLKIDYVTSTVKNIYAEENPNYYARTGWYSVNGKKYTITQGMKEHPHNTYEYKLDANGDFRLYCSYCHTDQKKVVKTDTKYYYDPFWAHKQNLEFERGLNNTITFSENWITISYPTGSNYILTLSENHTKAERSSYIYELKGQTLVAVHRIRQKPTIKVKLDCTGGNFGTAGPSTTVLVTVDNREFTVGKKYENLPTPKAPEGYTFEAWYTQKTGGVKIDSTKDVNLSYKTLYARWKIDVSFNVNGGSGSVSSRTYYKDSKYGSLPSAPTAPTGFTFAGWYTEKNGGKKIETSTSVGTYKTLYARWKIDVSFNVNGGSGSVSNKTYYKGTTYGSLPNAPTAPTGFTFAGWYTEKNGGKKIETSTSVGTYKTLYARWKVDVSFNVNGGSGSVSNKTYYKGTTYGSLPNAPTAPTGFTFAGWYTEKNGGKKIETSTSVGTYKTLYARWKIDVTFDVNGGSGSVSSKTYYKGTTYGNLPGAPTAPTGFTFAGWYTEKNGGKKIETSTSVGTNKTLYARWKIDVSFNVNGGSGSVSNKTYYKGTTYGSLPNAPTAPKGFTFVGWYTGKTDGKKIETSTSVGTNKTLYAHWTPNEYTVKYDANGGKNAPAAQKKIHGTNLTLTKNTPSRDGYTFLGWAYSSAAKVADFIADATNIYKDDKATTLYAVWEKTSYTICYNANKGVGGPDPQIKYHDQDIVLSTVEPVRDGYTFLGWATSETATSPRYIRGVTHTYSDNASITLHAVWYETLWVTYDVNGGDAGSGPTKRKLDLNKSLHEQIATKEPTRKGYTFFGWNTKADGTGDFFFLNDTVGKSEYNPSRDITLYAMWNNPNSISNSDGEGYIYSYVGYILPNGETKLPIDIPPEYYGYYKLVVQSPISGVEYDITTKSEMGLFAPKIVNWNSQNYYFINSDLEACKPYLRIENKTNKPQKVVASIEAENYNQQGFGSETSFVFARLDQPSSLNIPVYSQLDVFICPRDVEESLSMYDFVKQFREETRGVITTLRHLWYESLVGSISESFLDSVDSEVIGLIAGKEYGLNLSSYNSFILGWAASIATDVFEKIEDGMHSGYELPEWFTNRVNRNMHHDQVTLVFKKKGEDYILYNKAEPQKEISLKTYLTGKKFGDLKACLFENEILSWSSEDSVEIQYQEYDRNHEKSDAPYGVRFSVLPNQLGYGDVILTDEHCYLQTWDGWKKGSDNKLEFRPGLLGELATNNGVGKISVNFALAMSCLKEPVIFTPEKYMWVREHEMTTKPLHD